MHHVGWGLYHSGVELCASAEHEGTEFTFDHHAGSASGVAWHAPYYSEQGRQDARSFAGGEALAARPSWLHARHGPRPTEDPQGEGCEGTPLVERERGAGRGYLRRGEGGA